MRDISLRRQGAELLTDLLMLTDAWPALEMDGEIRELFGMLSREEELKYRGITISEFRMEWARRIIDRESVDNNTNTTR